MNEGYALPELPRESSEAVFDEVREVSIKLKEGLVRRTPRN
jgi:hypothetical protein